MAKLKRVEESYSTSGFDSDASEADPNDIAKILKDTDDLDDGLFKSKNLSKTMPTSSNKSASIMQRNKSFSFDDDPLADFDSLVGKSRSVQPAAKSASNKQINFETEKKPPFSPSNNMSSTMPSSGYTPTGNKSNPKSNLFDDIEDNGLLDSLSTNKLKHNNTKPNENIPSTSASNKSKSLADELFGNKSSIKQHEEPTEFKLSDRYLNMSSQQPAAKQADDDFQFGGYVPSAVSNTPRAPAAAKRNVGFTDDLFGSDSQIHSSAITSPARPKTTSAININNYRSDQDRGNNNTNLSRTMPADVFRPNNNTNNNNNNDDWLSIVDPSRQPNKKASNDSIDELLRPRSDSITKASSSAPKQANNSDLDWLGFKDKDSDVLNTSNSNTKGVNSSPAKSKPPPAPTTHSSAINSPTNQMDIEKRSSGFLNNKDSMNSSFADSIENNNMDNRPSTAIITQSNTNNILNSILNNIQPIKGLDHKPQSKENSAAPSEAEDGWLSALISNKKTAEPKKPVPQHTNESSDKKFNGTDLTNKQFNNNNNTYSNLNSTTQNNFTKIKINDQMTNLHYDSNEIQAMLQKLEYENQDLHMQLQHSKAHYELQIQLIQDSCENRVRMLKEDRDNSMRLFKEEKDSMQAHIDLTEKEKLQLAGVYKKKSEDMQKEFDMETERLRQLQRDTIEKLKQDHDDALKRVKYMKDTEIDAAMAATSHSRTIESVLNLIEDNTKNLDGLSEKVKMGHMINLNEHEVQIRNKEEYLKIQEERLNKKQREYEAEIRSLNETIQRLENHLAEQSKSVAEERWKGKQQEKKLEALQDALLNEQRIVMDKLARERNDIERSKDDILVEQKRLMQQIYEEKRKIAEERAQVEAAVSSYKDRQHKDSLSNINIEAEISVSTRRLNDEKLRIEQLSRDIKEKENQLQQEKHSLEEKNKQIEIKTAKLEQMAVIVNKKYQDADDLIAKSTKEKENNIKILDQANNIRSGQEARLNQIQQQLANANERESQLNQEKIAIYKQRQELELFKSTITCNKCKEPVKDFGLLGLSMPTNGYGSYIQANLNSTQTSQTYNSPMYGYSINSSNLEDAKLLRQLKMQALKDRQFIIEEKQFIDTLERKNSLNLLN